jgi:hypothetical protein
MLRSTIESHECPPSTFRVQTAQERSVLDTENYQ